MPPYASIMHPDDMTSDVYIQHTFARGKQKHTPSLICTIVSGNEHMLRIQPDILKRLNLIKKRK